MLILLQMEGCLLHSAAPRHCHTDALEYVYYCQLGKSMSFSYALTQCAYVGKVFVVVE